MILCDLFGPTLDRQTLWPRINSALTTAAAKCDDGDVDRFASLCLEHVKALPGKVSRSQTFAAWVLAMGSRDDAYRQAFVRHCANKSQIVIVHARAAWTDPAAVAERDKAREERQRKHAERQAAQHETPEPKRKARAIKRGPVAPVEGLDFDSTDAEGGAE